jgi:outer membrane protein assembly factor BamB
MDFAGTAPVPEASGAAWLTISRSRGTDGALSLIVVSDSGNDGAYVILDPDTGAVWESGKLPLGGPGDDLEGAAVRGGKLYAISSSGWIRVWERDGGGFKLVDGPYPIGPVDLDKGKGKKPPKSDGMVCPQAKTNCGRNYEGLCLAPETHLGNSPCVGFAAAKADGHLYCLVERDGKLELDRTVPSIEITKPGAMADCAFSDDGTLLVGSNTFDLNAVYRVDNWRTPGSAKVVDVGSLGPGFAEVIATRGDVIYRMSDLGGSPSTMAKFRCTR